MNIVTVNRLIECRRNELNVLVSTYGIKDQRVMVKSIQLDRIINMYIHKKFHKLHQPIDDNYSMQTEYTSCTKEFASL